MEVKERKRQLKKQACIFGLSLTITLLLVFVCTRIQTLAAPTMTVDLGTGDAEGAFGTLELIVLFAILALLPSLLVMMTSFTRIIIVLSLVRNALGTQQSPPNQVLIGIALFLTLFIMNPVLQEINTQAYEPYKDGIIDSSTAMKRAAVPIKQFMLRNTKEKDLELFISISGNEDFQLEEGRELESLTDLGLEVITPAFITSELEHAFLMGFLLFLPFLIIDMVVSSALMSMGMVMLPPSMIALPFKLMMFIMVGGWNVLFDNLVRNFH